MVPQSISSLSGLEELNIPCGFTICDDADADVTSIYAELNKLTRLRNLTISLPYSTSCLDGDIIMSKLEEFNIAVGFELNDYALSYLCEKSISIKGNCIESGWMQLVERADQVYLKSVKGLSKHREAFTNLKRLRITGCDEIDHLVRLPEDGRNQPYFSNLCFLYIIDCGGLTYLFPASVANCLHKLQKLYVDNCNSIEDIVRVDNGEVIVSFPKLKLLYLRHLPSLKSFSIHNKIAFPSLEELTLGSLEEASEIWEKGIVYNERGSPSSFAQLKHLNVERCNKLENVIPVTLLHEFNNLEQVVIKKCQSLKSVFQGSDILMETDGSCIVFSSLKELHLQALPNMKRFWSCDGETNPTQPPKVSFPNLEHFSVLDCKSGGLAEQIEVARNDDSPSTLISMSLRYVGEEAQFVPSQWLQNLQSLQLNNCIWREHSLFDLTPNTLQYLHITICKMIGPALFNTSFFRAFQQLKYLTVSDCDSLEEIVEEEDIGIDQDEKTISLPCLTSLILQELPSLTSFSRTSTYTFNMPALTDVHLSRCPRMDKFTSLPINTSLLLEDYREPISDLNRYVREKVYASIAEQESVGEGQDVMLG